VIVRYPVVILCEHLLDGRRCMERAEAVLELRWEPGRNEPYLSGFWPPPGWACVSAQRFWCPSHAGMLGYDDEETPVRR